MRVMPWDEAAERLDAAGFHVHMTTRGHFASFEFDSVHMEDQARTVMDVLYPDELIETEYLGDEDDPRAFRVHVTLQG